MTRGLELLQISFSLTFNLSKMYHIALMDALISSNGGIAHGYRVMYDALFILVHHRRTTQWKRGLTSERDMVELISI